MNLNEYIIDHIFEYVHLLDKRKIKKDWYIIANKNKNYIWKWYKKYKKIMEDEIENFTVISQNWSMYRLKSILLIAYPDENKIDMMYYLEATVHKPVRKYLNQYYIPNYIYKMSNDLIEFDFNIVKNLKQIWFEFINDCNEDELQLFLI
jgi:hypothetical protein